jgi:hypothetical protein
MTGSSRATPARGARYPARARSGPTWRRRSRCGPCARRCPSTWHQRSCWGRFVGLRTAEVCGLRLEDGRLRAPRRVADGSVAGGTTQDRYFPDCRAGSGGAGAGALHGGGPLGRHDRRDRWAQAARHALVSRAGREGRASHGAGTAGRFPVPRSQALPGLVAHRLRGRGQGRASSPAAPCLCEDHARHLRAPVARCRRVRSAAVGAVSAARAVSLRTREAAAT